MSTISSTPPQPLSIQPRYLSFQGTVTITCDLQPESAVHIWILIFNSSGDLDESWQRSALLEGLMTRYLGCLTRGAWLTWGVSVPAGNVAAFAYSCEPSSPMVYASDCYTVREELSTEKFLSEYPALSLTAGDSTLVKIPDKTSSVGGGGFCDLYHGIFSPTGQLLALKKPRLRTQAQGQAADVERRFRREALLWSSLSHPNVLPFYGILEIMDDLYLVSPWVQWGDLSKLIYHRLQLGNTLWEEEHNDNALIKLLRAWDDVDVVLQIASGMAYLHSGNTVHGDIKALNILIGDRGRPMLCDFGMSKVLDDVTVTSTAMKGTGSMQWMAPELLENEPRSTSSDMYALGLTIGEILTGDAPFKGLHQGAVMVAIMTARCPAFDPQVVSARQETIVRTYNLGKQDELRRRQSFLWSIADQCTRRQPTDRLTANDAYNMLLHFSESTTEREPEVEVERRGPSPPVDVLLSPESAQPSGPHPLSTLSTHPIAPTGDQTFNTNDQPRSVASPQPPLSSLLQPGLSATSAPSTTSEWTMAALMRMKVDEVPPEFKKERSDWFMIFNPEAQRKLDVGLKLSLQHDSPVHCVRFSADGKYLATGCISAAQIYDMETGAKTCTLRHEGIECVCFSPDGKLLATGGHDGRIRIWNIVSRTIRQTFTGHTRGISSLDFSRNGRVLVSGSNDKTARVWDMSDDKHRALSDVELDTFGFGVQSVAISSDGRHIAAGCYDSIIRIWDVATGNLIERLRGHSECVWSVAFTSDGKGLVSGSKDKTLKFWSLVPLLDSPNRATALSQDGTRLRRGQGGEKGCASPMTFTGHSVQVYSVAVSPDDTWIVSGSGDKGVHFWDPRTGVPQLRFEGHRGRVLSVDFSPIAEPTGGLLATGSWDKTVKVWSYTPVA